VVLYAFDLIEQDGDELRDLPLIERKRPLAKLLGSAKRAVTRDGRTAFPKDWSLRTAALSVRERHSRMRPPLLMKA
jgi:ATP-dependent DNA ligase